MVVGCSSRESGFFFAGHGQVPLHLPPPHRWGFPVLTCAGPLALAGPPQELPTMGDGACPSLLVGMTSGRWREGKGEISLLQHQQDFS